MSKIDLVLQILPLYFLVLIGYLGVKLLDIRRESIARLVVYFITPGVVFLGTIQAKGSPELYLIPLISFLVPCIMILICSPITKIIWSEEKMSRMATFASTGGNYGYFGLPLCIAYLGDEVLAPVTMFIFGGVVFENSLGVYTLARANYSKIDAIKKMATIPTLYGFVIALSMNLFDIPLWQPIEKVFILAKGAYGFLGMTIIGMGLAGVKFNKDSTRIVSFTTVTKFILWPLIIQGVLLIEMNYFDVFSPLVRKVILLESIVPVAANTVAYSVEFDTYPEKAAFAVLCSTLLALVYIPFVAAFLI